MVSTRRLGKENQHGRNFNFPTYITNISVIQYIVKWYIWTRYFNSVIFFFPSMKENSIGHTYVACGIFLLSNELTRRGWITETLLDSGVQSQLNYLRNSQIAIAYTYTHRYDEWTSIINGIHCRCLSFLRRADNGWYVKSLIMILLTDYEQLLMDLKKALAQTKPLKPARLSALSVESTRLQVCVVSISCY